MECDHIFLIVLPQTLNNKNNFGLLVIDACDVAANKYGNSTFTNKSTYEVYCEIKWEKTLTP